MAGSNRMKLKIVKSSLGNAGNEIMFNFVRDSGDQVKRHNIWVTGDLWGSITHDKVKVNKNKVEIRIKSDGSKLSRSKAKENYTKYIIDGHGSVMPRPFFKWAWEQNLKEYENIIKKNIE